MKGITSSLIIILCLGRICCFSQSIAVTNFCSFANSENKTCGDTLRFNVEPLNTKFYSDEVESVIKLLGLKNSLYLFRTEKNGIDGYFIKENIDLIPKIILNTNFLHDTVSSLVIIFHELGHYLNDNEKLCSNPSIELDADQFSGLVMSKLNFNKLECLKCYDLINEGDGITHPVRQERKIRFLKGWEAGKIELKVKSFTSINPTITWTKSNDTLKVNVDEKQYKIFFSKNRMIENLSDGANPYIKTVYDDAIGLLYIGSENYSIQLISPENSDRNGIGRLINDRTSIVFVRLMDKFRYYDKGIEIKRYQTIAKGFINNDQDYCLEFIEENSTNKKTILFPNYGFSRKTGFLLQPAIYK